MPKPMGLVIAVLLCGVACTAGSPTSVSPQVAPRSWVDAQPIAVGETVTGNLRGHAVNR